MLDRVGRILRVVKSAPDPKSAPRLKKCPRPKKWPVPKINIYPLIDLYPVIGENTLASHPVTASFIFCF